MTTAKSPVFVPRLQQTTSGRAYVLFLCLILPLMGTGCQRLLHDATPDKGQQAGHAEDVTIVVQTDKSRIQQEENTLIAQQQNLAQERIRLQQERQHLSESLSHNPRADAQSIQNFQEKQSQLSQQEQKLLTEQQAFEHARSRLDADKTALLARLESLSQKTAVPEKAPPHDEIAQVLQRHEALMLEREKALAHTEQTVTQLLQQLQSVTESLQAQIQAQNQAQTFEAPLDKRSGSQGRISRAQLQQQVTQIEQQMRSKGILTEDLPQAMQSYAQIQKKGATPQSMQESQDTLERTQRFVSAARINRAFVESKMARINHSFQQNSGKLVSADQKRIEQWLTEATDAFSDGRYDRANRKINDICGLLEPTQSK